MVKVLRWLGGGLLALLGLVLALVAVWAATQGPDAAPRPLPAALELPARAAAPTATFQQVEDLLAPDDDGPVRFLQGPPLVCDRHEDCATLWSRDVAAVAAQLRANNRLGERCEGVQAAVTRDGSYVEWLPERVGPAMPLPAAQGNLVTCQRWWIGQALVAATSGDAATAQARLQQSNDWALGALSGTRSRFGHSVAIRQRQMHLQAVAAVALLRPDWAPSLDAVAAPWPDDLLNPARWMPFEAATVRRAIDDLDASCRASGGQGAPETAGGPVTRLTGLLCRYRIGWHPEATRQQGDAVWLARIERLRDGPLPWLEAARPRAAQAVDADDPSAWAWRNTMGVLMVRVGQDDALYDDSIASPADLALHAQMLAATLALRGAGVPPAEREAWLAASGLLPPEVLARVRWEPDGRALRWQTWDADLRGEAAATAPRAPSRIPL